MTPHLLRPDGSLADGRDPIHLTPTEAGWTYSGLGVVRFSPGESRSTDYSKTGFGMHRTYPGEGDPGEPFEIDTTVGDGDVFLVPRGYHGPCIAAPGYPMYYLNILAGPGGERSMAFCDDPTHHWLRDEWQGMPTDPRCPMTDSAGVIEGVTSAR